MTREEAIKEAYGIPVTKAQHEALLILIPELAESEDEMIRKNLIELLLDTPAQDIISHHLELSKVLDYLEKQKECLADNGKTSASEDESIRKEMIRYFTEMKKGGSVALPYDDCIAYLEKQKEQKPIPKFKVGDCIYDKRDSYNRNVIREVGKDYYINAFAQKMDMVYTDANFEFLEHLDDDIIPNKPAEWSEEDDKFIKELCNLLASIAKNNYVGRYYAPDLVSKLQSLRLQPKQELKKSEIEHLHTIASFIKSTGYEDDGEFIEGVANKLSMTRKEIE